MKSTSYAFTIAILLALTGGSLQADELPLEKIRLPEGFHIEVFAEGVEDARSLTRSESGTLFVGSRRAGKVYAVVDRDGDFRADEVFTLAEGLNMPNGVAFRDGDLYVAEVSRVLRYPKIEEHLADPPEATVVRDTFPSDKHHGWKFIAFSPDGKLYVPVGAPCNVCDEGDPYAALLRMEPDGSGLEIFARGIRNTVGFDWHPETGVLWFTDNGRDLLGDDRPPDELNRAPRPGMHFGFPFCHAGEIEDPEHGELGECSETTPPAVKLGPHVAAIGMRFYTGESFPERFHDQILIAEHGSWNRSKPIGYRVTLVTVDGEGNATDYEVFAEGWLQEGKGWGRPVDLEVLPDGSILLSDDLEGVIYRIAYDAR
jgi:glucose/arabinose dehydrogenase